MKKKLRLKPAVCILRPNAPTDKINPTSVRRILAILGHGLTGGVGYPKPGRFCVEAAVAFGMGYDHNDRPRCVSDDVAEFKIELNDEGWSSPKARGRGLRAIAIAQLGTNDYEKGTVEVDDSTLRMAIAGVLARRATTALARLYAVRVTKVTKERIDILERLLNTTLGDYLDDNSSYSPYNYLKNELPDDYYLQRLLGRRGKKDSYFCWLADIGTAALVALKTPGSKYLYLLAKKK